jgi:hypothetical protein
MRLRADSYNGAVGSQKSFGGEGILMTRAHSSVGRWNRRDFLKGGTAALAGLYGLRPDWALADVPLQFDGSNFKLAAPEPNPKSGGVLRYGITMRPPHFDVHQSGTINSLASQAVMFDNLIRRDPRDSGKTIIPDLAHRLGHLEGRHDLHLHAAQGRLVP